MTDAIKRPLTPKQAQFVREYLVDLNATKAAIRAGYSAKTAERIGHQLLKETPVVADAIQAGMDKRSAATNITAERVLAEIAKLAFFDPRKMFDDDGAPIHVSKLDDDTAAAIAGLDVVTQGNQDVGFAQILKVKLTDKSKNLELLGRHLKLFTDKTEVHHTGLAELLAAIGGTALKPVPDEAN